MLAWLAPLIVFGLVVFVHELGHFLAAKLRGVYAPVFALGWGPRLIGIKKGETDYRISWFPIGGYVAMASRESEALSAIEGSTSFEAPATVESPDDLPGHRRGLNPVPFDENALRPFGPKPVPSNRWIESQPLAGKVFILSAGVLMNIVLAYCVSTGVLLSYGKVFSPTVIDSIVPNTPAMRAGLQKGDSVVAVDGKPVRMWNEVVGRIRQSVGQPLQLDVMRHGQRVALVLTPESSADSDLVTGKPITVGRIGAGASRRLVNEPVGLGEAMVGGWTATWRLGGMIFGIVKGLFSGDVSVKQLGGPIAIVRVSVEAGRNGWQELWYLVALISINVAILNMFPVPLLDGGQIVLRVVERIKGSEFSLRTQETMARVGIVAIMLLFVLVMFNDIKALFVPLR